MNFTNTSGAVVTSFQKPTRPASSAAQATWRAPNDQVRGPISRTLCAGFNRSTLLDQHQPAGPNDGRLLPGRGDQPLLPQVHPRSRWRTARRTPSPSTTSATTSRWSTTATRPRPTSQLDPFSGAATPIAGSDGGGGDGGSGPSLGHGRDARVQRHVRGRPLGRLLQRQPAADRELHGQHRPVLDPVGLDPQPPSAGAWTWRRRRLADGAVVQLWECNGTGAQSWTYRSGDQSIVNPQSGKCLTAVGGAPLHDGQRLEIRSCSGTAEQRWTF